MQFDLFSRNMTITADLSMPLNITAQSLEFLGVRLVTQITHKEFRHPLIIQNVGRQRFVFSSAYSSHSLLDHCLSPGSLVYGHSILPETDTLLGNCLFQPVPHLILSQPTSLVEHHERHHNPVETSIKSLLLAIIIEREIRGGTLEIYSIPVLPQQHLHRTSAYISQVGSCVPCGCP